MTKVVPQIMERNIGDLFPLTMGGPLLHTTPSGMQPAFGESPGMITSTAGRFVSAL